MPKKAPKSWWDSKEKEVRKSNPKYTDDQVKGTVGKIWNENMSEADRQKVLKKKLQTLMENTDKVIVVDNKEAGRDE